MNHNSQFRIADCGLWIEFRRLRIRNPKSEIRNRRSAFTLLEIILSLAILAGSLAALGEVMRLADQNASMTGDETQAQILAASIMDLLL